MRHLFPLFLLLSCLFTLLPGCEPKDELVQTSGSLEIEQDTVLFDTVFTTITTVTKRLWVHNRNSGAVKTDISLAGTQGNTYTLLIDGDLGPARSNVLIRGNDSLLVLVKAKLGETGVDKPFLLTDQLNFLTNGDRQDVKLVAYGQDAYFHRADLIRTSIIWPNDKPHVIINSTLVVGNDRFDGVGVYVPAGVRLTIQPGTKVYCHAGATMQVDGTLLINPNFNPLAGDTATADSGMVRFMGDRREAGYGNIPGQWGGIFFTSTSRSNVIRYAEIKNATFGASILNLDAPTIRPDLRLENVIFRNISGSNPNYAGIGFPPGGVVGVLGSISATNCLFTNCGEYAVLGYGGNFSLNFCTIANYTPSFRRQTASLTFSNELEGQMGPLKFPLTVSLTNSIVWGSIEDELAFINSDEYYPTGTNGSFLNVRNCLLRTKEYAATTNATDKPGLGAPAYDNTVNQPPNFKSTPENPSGNYDYRPVMPSPALGRPPFVTTGITVPAFDLFNLRRNGSTPAIGAYEQR